MDMTPDWLWRSKNRQRADVHLPEVAGVDPHDPVLSHLDAQIRWYNENAQRTMSWHFRLRGTQLIVAAAIPVTQIFAGALAWRIVAGSLGGLIAICQGFDTMHHYGEHYVAWRATCQQLRRERQLFSAQSGPYAQLPPGSPEALRELAARVDSIEGQEQQHWQTTQLQNSTTDDSTQQTK